MSDFLAEMAGASAIRAKAARSTAGGSALASRVASAPPPRRFDLAGGGFDILAEAKLASPSQGRLVAGATEAAVVDLARDLAAAGAIGISVLTEETRFGGSLRHLEAVSAAVDVPVMRKDFLVDPIQIDEARAAGASGVLLIARILTDSQLTEMTDRALELGMFALIEVFDLSDVERAGLVFDRDVLVGVNCRDLTTLDVDRKRLRALAPHLPERILAVAESGIESEEDVVDVVRSGYRLALIGTSLVTSDRPAEVLCKLLGAGRSALTGSTR